MDLAVWLRTIGLEQYEAAFRENAIDDAVLPKLTAEDLKDLGVTAVGHRRKLLEAIAELRSETKAEGSPSNVSSIVAPPNQGYRRTPSSHGDVLGACRLNGPVDAHGPGGPPGTPFGVPEVRSRHRAGLWWVRRKVYGRRCPDLLWVSPVP
jgi:hypothetical protein